MCLPSAFNDTHIHRLKASWKVPNQSFDDLWHRYLSRTWYFQAATIFPLFLRFFLHQKMPILPCTEYNPLFDRFFGTVRVTWSMTQRRSNRARNSSLGCCVSASLIRWLGQCQKSGQKADYIQCRARLASFGAGKIAKIGGKLWQLESIMSLTDIYVRGHQSFDLEPFMRLLVCECGYHWRLRVSTCAKVDGAQHPQRK